MLAGVSPKPSQKLVSAGNKRIKLVEAAGVEPASEKARHAVTTCVSDSVIVGCPRLNQQDTSNLVRLISTCRLRTEAMDPACENDAYRPGHRRPGQGGYLKIRQRMQTACWQLWFSDRFTGARNPARPNTTNQSRRNRCAPFQAYISISDAAGPLGVAGSSTPAEYNGQETPPGR